MAGLVRAGGGMTPGRRRVMWGAVVMLLLVPLAAMQVTREVAWTPLDFAAAALLLGGAAAATEGAMQVVRSPHGRALAGFAILTALVLLWLQGAVGLV